MPREIALAPKGSPAGLLFRPLPEVASLHADAGANSSIALAAGATKSISPKDGLHCHISATVSMPPTGAANVTLTIRAYPAGTKAGAGSLAISIVQDSAGNRTLQQGSGKRQSAKLTRGTGTVTLEVFVDGPISESFGNGGEALLTSSGHMVYASGSGITLSSSVATHVDLSVWSMQKSIKTDDDDASGSLVLPTILVSNMVIFSQACHCNNICRRV